jgi:hypothetical protein
LSDVPYLVTVESCQESPCGDAWVVIEYGPTNDFQTLGSLVQRLAAFLGGCAAYHHYTLCLEWFGSNDQPHGRISLEPADTAAIAADIRRFAALTNRRTCELADDSRCTAPRN